MGSSCYNGKEAKEKIKERKENNGKFFIKILQNNGR